jgi:large subunit ribosomal protein L24
MAHNPKEKKPLHLAKLHVHKGDTVLILAGKDRGKTGKVLRSFPRESKVIVEGLNIVKRHMRAGRGVLQSGVIEKPMPIHSSNVMVQCSECGKPTRIAHERVSMGTDQKLRTRRVCKQCGKPIQEHARE